MGRGSLGIYCLLIDRAERVVGWSGGLRGGILNSELIPQTLGVMGPPGGILPGLVILPPTQGNHLNLQQPSEEKMMNESLCYFYQTKKNSACLVGSKSN